MADETREARIVITVPEAARALDIGRNSAYAAVRRGDLPAIRMGRRLLVSKAALEQLVAETRTHPAKPEQGRSE